MNWYKLFAFYVSFSSITKADPIQVFSHALPITTDSVEFDVSSFIAPMMIGFAFTIIPAGLTMDLVLDREVCQEGWQRLRKRLKQFVYKDFRL